jgi:signal peptidase II
MQNNFIEQQLRVLFVSLSVIIIDQVTKFLVKGLNIGWLGIHFTGIPYGTPKRLFGEGVKILYVENAGIAFGIDLIPKIFLICFTIIAAFIILYYIFKHRNDSFLLRLALAFILAGAVGNLLDRMFYGLIYGYAPLSFGRVVDFIQFAFWDFTIFGKTFSSWPIMNIADLSVTTGFLIIILFRKRIFRIPEEVKEELPAVEKV